MKETFYDSANTLPVSTSKIGTNSDLKPMPVMRETTQVQKFEDSSSNLKAAALTSLQQLNKSGHLLLSSMETVILQSEELVAMKDENGDEIGVQKELDVKSVVACAEALASTVQTQANLVKVLKEFI